MPEEIARLDRQSATLRRGIEGDHSYAEGVIEKSEFTPRIAGLKQRLSQLEERRQAAEDAAGLERDLSLHHQPHGRFRQKGREGLDNLDRDGKRQIVDPEPAGSKSTKTTSRSFPVAVNGGSPATGCPQQRPSFTTLYGRPSSAPSRGSIVADGSPRIGKISTQRRSRSCASPQSASCSESSAIQPQVSARETLEFKLGPAQDDHRGYAALLQARS